MPSIETAVNNGIAQITLNRPAALNAIDDPMFVAIGEALDAWIADPAVRAVTLRGAGKAFSAGGDVRYVSDAARNGRPELGDALYRKEYRIDLMIHHYPKPVIAIIDGFCMGGGMGLAMHAAYRVVTERALLAMPETQIGFFPDCRRFVAARATSGCARDVPRADPRTPRPRAIRANANWRPMW